MKRSGLVVSTCALITSVCVVLALLPMMASAGPATQAIYDDDVTPELHALVSADQYHSIVAELNVVARRLLCPDTIRRVAASPCGRSLFDLAHAYATDPAVRSALEKVATGFADLPPVYERANPWKAATTGDELLRMMLEVFGDWCVFLPQIGGGKDDGLAFIQKFAWFYYHNEAGITFVQGHDPLDKSQPLPVGRDFTEDFRDQRGAFLDSPASTNHVAQWVDDPRIEISDYQKQRAEEFSSWNDFFTREIIVDSENQAIPSRPATMPLSEYPERDYIVVAPTDCIMNPLVQVLVDDGTVERRLLENPLQFDTVLDVKSIPISVDQLLAEVPDRYREPFVGGTGLSCVLMPNTYHHFHAPVNGTVVHAEVLEQFGTFGYSDWPNWVPADGNVGRPGTDFSQFQQFERGVIVIEVKYANVPGAEPAELTGYVASIPVGLNTIGSVVLDEDIAPGTAVKRGYTRLGHFRYGGSLDILLFSRGLASGAIQTRLGNQIGLLNAGTTPSTD